MSFWSEADCEAENDGVVESPVGHAVKFSDGCFKLSLDDEAYASNTVPSKLKHDFGKDRPLVLEPGQFAYLITMETVRIPKSALGLINLRTGLKLQGLVNVSGFHVDPGYFGKLVIGVQNASPMPIVLKRHARIFRLWLLDYAGSDSVVGKEGYTSIPEELIERLVGTYPSASSLKAQIDELAAQVNKLEGRVPNTKYFMLALFGLLFPFVYTLYANVFGEILNIDLRAAATYINEWFAELTADIEG